MKDHEKREFINELKDVALKYHSANMLREKIHDVVSKYLEKTI